MNGGTTVDPGALQRIAGEVEALADQINSTVGTAHGITGGSGSAGREYSVKGSAYAQVAFPRTQALINDYENAVDDLADRISDSATNYTTVEANNQDVLAQAGAAMSGVGAAAAGAAATAAGN